MHIRYFCCLLYTSEPLTLEDVLSIHEKEKPVGVIAQFGGQTPLNLAADLKKNGVNILGTTPETDVYKRQGLDTSGKEQGFV